MKKAFALVGAIALTLAPSTLTAENLIAKESHTKQRMHFLNDDLSDGILNALERKGYTLQPGANFKVAKLRDIGAEGTDLTNEDLRSAPLSGSNLRGANLSGVDLNGRDLSGADLIGANLRGANLSGADLSGADLRGANLTSANLSGANLTDAVLTSAKLNKANLSGADLRGANLRGANLSGADLSGVVLNRARMDGADLSNANLNGVIAENISGCPKFLPEGWVCEDNSLIPPEPEFFTFKPFLVNKKVKVFNNSLPYQIECFEGEFLKINLSDNGKFLVQLDEKNKYDGFDFKKAGKKFKKTYKKCSLPTTQPGSPFPTTQPVISNPNPVPSSFYELLN